jgi:hypothetical protein
MTKVFAIAVLAALAGCGAFDSVPSGAVTNCQVVTLVPSKTDILFVVDDSGSMRPVQANLAQNFDAFIERLSQSAVQSDFQIGITTTSVDWPIAAANAAFTVKTTYDDGTPYPAGALVAASGKAKILPSSSPTLVEDFRANVNVGTLGAAKEQGLRAAQLAVTDRIVDGKNAGFLRQGARLAVIIVTDEDDCSDPASPPAVVYPTRGDACHTDEDQAKLPPVSTFAKALREELAGQTRSVVVAVIAGVDPQTREPANPVCSPGGVPAKRYKVLVDDFGGAGLIDDVCQPDFTGTLQDIAGLIDQNVDLDQALFDPDLLTVSVSHAGGSTTACKLAQAGGDTSAADAVYTGSDPRTGRLPSLTFQRSCALGAGDQVHVQVLCAN